MPKAHRLLLAGMVAALFGQPVGAEDLLQVYHQSMESDPALKAAAASRQASPRSRSIDVLLLFAHGMRADATVTRARTNGGERCKIGSARQSQM